MTREAFTDRKFHDKSLATIRTANAIIADLQSQGLRLTLRQLYYQFVAHHGLPNSERSYKNLGKVLSEARLAGLVDWDAIEDRGRQPMQWAQFPSIKEAAERGVRTFRLPRWEDQDNYVELWVEKQALAGVLEPIAARRHVTLMVNKGYSSQSAMYESAQRFVDMGGDRDKFLLYIGDHDPSGEDMVRDVAERLRLFGVRGLQVEKLALTMEQIEEHSPPPNPAKWTDSRAAGYVAQHGEHSWEVDSLSPATLVAVIEERIASLVDEEKMQAVIERENKQKAALRRALSSLKLED